MLRSAIAVVVAVMIASASGCGGRDDRAATIDTDSSSGKGKAESEAQKPNDAASGLLTQKQVDDALLTVTDLPSGWTLGEPSETEEESEDEIKPAKCATLLDAMEADDEKAAAEGEREFNKGGPFGTQMGMSISSYEKKANGDKLKTAADVFGQCSSFKGTDNEGVTSEYRVAPLSLANIGDDSLALTITVESEEFTIPLNVYLVVIGHNVMTFYNGGIAGADGAELEKIGKLAINRLESAVKK